jgi:hypothetical protein
MKLKDLDGMDFEALINLKGSDIESMLSDARGVIKKSRVENQACIERSRALTRELAELEGVVGADYSIYVRNDVVGVLRQLPLFEGV